MSQVPATKQEAKTAEEAKTCRKHRRLTESIAQSAVSACEHKRPKTSRLTMSSGHKRNLASYYRKLLRLVEPGELERRSVPGSLLQVSQACIYIPVWRQFLQTKLYGEPHDG